ncbi:hybrid sensor histidine kinase/response regulator [Desulfogranum mediterraneum]|uniref:hybrid sensor histidine kinase/response regulator n=1 Tax=Desulfogranum mediterraneum TaxID=160661 RepID=UPI00041A4478|nr:response regulator [Desulfogranum mediterraneum]
MKILIAEDNEDSRVLLENVLTASGYEVQSAENGKQALARMEEGFLPDLIISDILMPEMDGYALCRTLKADERFQLIPLVFYTATYTDPKDEQFAMSLGASRFLIKPMEMPLFLAEIEGILEEQRQGKLPTGKGIGKKEPELEREYSEILARKLDKKIRELKDERDKLRQSEQKYRRLVEAIRNNYFFYTRDTKGVFSYLSPSITTVLGYTPAEFFRHYSDYLTDNPLNLTVEHHSELSMQGVKQPAYELEIFHRDGSVRHLEVTEEPIFGQDGQVVAVEGIAHDITERHQAEQELAKARDEWEMTFQAINDSVTILDPQLRILRTNLATSTLLGAKPEELLGQPCYALFDDGHQPCAGCPVTATLSDNCPHFGEVEHKRLNRTFLVSSFPRFDKDGKLVSIVETAKDITEKKRLEHQLRQTQKMEAIGTLAGGIAHDFNNILSAIIGYSELIQREVAAESKTGRYVGNILEAGGRAADLVKQILTFSHKAESDKQPLLPHLIVKEALKLLRATLPTTLSIEEDIEPDCGTILADPTNLHQIVINLCTNGLQAMTEQKGILGVRLQAREVAAADIPAGSTVSPGNFIVLTVTDTGVGMDQATMDRIFEPFFTTREEGTGMGLALVHGIVRDSHGFMVVKSEAGKGSSFAAYFPVSQEERPATTRSSQQLSPKGRGEHILVVDDDPLLARVTKTQLRDMGYKVTATSNSQDALEKIAISPDRFDLLVTDQTMPGLTGTELTLAAKAIKPGLPVILCTGHSDLVSKQKALELGIQRYVAKPITGNELLQAVRAVLDES